MVTFDDLERNVADVVMEAEMTWAGQASAAALEFVLPRALLTLPVHRWRKELDSPDPRPLWLDYPIVLRSLERMRSRHWHRVWLQRWATLTKDPSATRVHFAQPTDLGERHRIDALLSDPRWVLLVMAAPPPSAPSPGIDDAFTAALRSGLPALVWHPEASSDALREVVAWLVEGDGLTDLPARAQASRRAAFQGTPALFNLNIARDLVVLWDDPGRLVSDQPGQLRPAEDTADERQRTPRRGGAG